MEIIDYFRLCERGMPDKRTALRKSALALRRSGLVTMEELCALRRGGSERLAETRNIGPLALTLIDRACENYETDPAARRPD